MEGHQVPVRGTRPRHESEPELPHRRRATASVKGYDASLVGCYALRLMDREGPRQAQRHICASQRLEGLVSHLRAGDRHPGLGQIVEASGPFVFGKVHHHKVRHWAGCGASGKGPQRGTGMPGACDATTVRSPPPGGAYTMATTTPRAPFMSPKGTVGISQVRFCVSITRAPTHKCSARRTWRKSSAALCKPRGSLCPASTLTTTPVALAEPGAP